MNKPPHNALLHIGKKEVMKIALRLTSVVTCLFTFAGISRCQSITSIATVDNHIFIGVSGSGIMRSDDDGAHWSYVNRNISDSTAVNLLSVDTHGNLFSASGAGKVYYSTNNGDDWILSVNGLPPNSGAYCLSPDSSGRLFFGNSLGLFRQTIPGGSWTKVSDSLLYDPSVLSMTITESGKIFISSTALGPSGMVPIAYCSTDQGDNWARIDSGRLYYGMLHLGEDTVFAGGYQTGLYQSTDGGGSWSMTGMPDSWIVSLTKSDRYIYVGSNTIHGVYRLLPSGDSLEYLTAGPDDVHALAAGRNSTLLAGASSGLFVSTDGGLDWTVVPLLTTAVEDQGIYPPDAFLLEQNYPNPFNPTTTISVHLPYTAGIEIKVFDMLGREISTMNNGVMTAGTHEIQLDAGILASGVYFCRARYLNTVQYIRLVLTR